MTAFRDNFANEPHFAQHVGVAEDLLDQIERIPGRLGFMLYVLYRLFR